MNIPIQNSNAQDLDPTWFCRHGTHVSLVQAVVLMGPTMDDVIQNVHDWVHLLQAGVPYIPLIQRTLYILGIWILLGFNTEKYRIKGVKLHSGTHLLKSERFKINTLVYMGYSQILHQSKFFFFFPLFDLLFDEKLDLYNSQSGLL